MEFQEIFLCCLLSWLLATLDFCQGHSENEKVLLVSFDGFRWDYLDMDKVKGHTPNFESLIKHGVVAKRGIKNTMITKTFPNHFTIATGMYEENHGVVANEVYDPVYKESAQLSARGTSSNPKWFNNGTKNGGGEPIWVTNQKGEQLVSPKRSGVFFWPGSEAKLHGLLPFKYMHYNGSIPNRTRIDTIVKWFSDEQRPINLGLLYFSEPDHLGHQVGPNDPKMKKMVIALDGIVGYLIKQLKKHNLFDDMNLVITSDHGMAEVKPERVIPVDKYINPSWYTSYGGSPIWNILPKRGKEKAVFDGLKGKHPHLHVYKKEEIPRRYHYTYNRRIQPIVLVPDVGWYIVHKNTSKFPKTFGAHGYNNSDSSMHPFFIAHGPAFKVGYETKPFNNTDIYPLLCHILNIKPAKHDGSLNNVRHILRPLSTMSEINITFTTYILAVVLAATLAGVFSVAACRTHRMHMRRHGIRMQMKNIPNSNHNHNHLDESKSKLLGESEEEEIP